MTGQQRDPPAAGDAQLREAAIAGVRWFAVARIATECAQLAAAMVLARLITPAEFGNAAIALIFLPLSVILTYEGFGSALVQRKLVRAGHFEAATLTSIASGFALTALTFLLAPVIAAPLFSPEVASLIQLVSPVFALAGFGTVSRAVLARRLDFRLISMVETGSVAIGAFASVGFAALGLGAEAIVLGGVLAAALASLALVVIVPPSRPRWRGAELGEITRFGAPASAAGAIYVAISNVDYAVLAARLNPAQVGIYWRAFQLGVLYQEKISGIMLRVAFPLYSRTGSLTEMRRLHERATRIHGAIVVPVLAVFVVIAPEVVPLVFGDAWRPAVAPAQVLAVAGMIAAVLTGYPQVMLAAGRPRELMLFNLCVLVAYGLTVYLTAPLGLISVATAVVGVYLAIFAGVYLVLFRGALGLPARRMATDVSPALAGSVPILALGALLAGAMRGAGAGEVPVIVCVSLLGAVVQATVLRALFPDVWADASGLARRLLPARRPLRRPAAVPSNPG